MEKYCWDLMEPVGELGHFSARDSLGDWERDEGALVTNWGSGGSLLPRGRGRAIHEVMPSGGVSMLSDPRGELWLDRGEVDIVCDICRWTPPILGVGVGEAGRRRALLTPLSADWGWW